MRKFLLLIVCLAVVFFIAYTQLTLFVIPPIGAVPEGKTLVIFRLDKTEFIDSPDAMCQRAQGGINLLCRGVMLAYVANNSEIMVRLPYSEKLYLLSTGGVKYRTH